MFHSNAILGHVLHSSAPTPSPSIKKNLFRFTLISRIVLKVGKKCENFDPCLIIKLFTAVWIYWHSSCSWLMAYEHPWKQGIMEECTKLVILFDSDFSPDLHWSQGWPIIRQNLWNSLDPGKISLPVSSQTNLTNYQKICFKISFCGTKL